MTDQFEDKLNKQTSELLEQQSKQLDLKTQLALERARKIALDSANISPHSTIYGNVLILFHQHFIKLMASGLILAVLIWFSMSTQQKSTEITTPFTDLELLAGDESLEFYEQLSFYEWLENDGG